MKKWWQFWKRGQSEHALVAGPGNEWLLHKSSDGFVRLTVVTPSNDLAFSVVIDQRACGEVGRCLLHFYDFGELPDSMYEEPIQE